MANVVKSANKKSFLLFSASISLFAFSAFAQNVPSVAQPGIIIRGFEEKTRPASVIEDTLSLGKNEIKDTGASKEKIFTLNQVMLDGTTVYSQAEIDKLVKEYVGKSTSFADLNAIAQIITRQLRQDGYILSSAILPPQNIKGGIVHFKAVEGRINNVSIVGEYKDKLGLIQDYANKIKSSGPANTKTIERYLLLMDDLPGIKARSVIKPSDVPNAGDLVITIEQDKFEGAASIDNRGSRYIGPYRATLVGVANSLLDMHDRTTARAVVTSQTKELRFADITHEQQLGADGVRLKARAAVTQTEPGDRLRAFDLRGDSALFDVETYYPVVRSRQYNLNVLAGFNALNSTTELFNAESAEDHVRSFRVGSNLDFSDAWAGVNQFDLTLTKGIDGLGATSDGANRSRSNGEHDFLRSNLSASRLQELWGNFSLYATTAGQYSSDPLLSSEEFAIGGSDYGRAYDAGEITGDKGLSGALELRYGQPVDNKYIDSYQLFSYYDAGKVWNEKIAVGESKSDSLTSVGAGVRLNLTTDTFASVELNKPLTRDVAAEGDDDSRMFFNLLQRF